MDNTSDEESEIIENTPPSSPKPKRKSTRGGGRDNESLPLVSIALKPLNEIQSMGYASTSPREYGSSVPSIEPPPYSPLTPRGAHGIEKQIIPDISVFSPGIRPGEDRNARLPLLPLESVTENHCMNDALPFPYEYGSSVPSIEPPPYSPLTPRDVHGIEKQIIPDIAAFYPSIRSGEDRNVQLPLLPLESVTENHCMNEALPCPYEYGSSVPSIEPPPYSPLTPRPLPRPTNPLSETAASSPVPSYMLSPLANLVDFDSDDSVKDVDYIQPKSKAKDSDDSDETICESDDSRVSLSIMNNNQKSSELTERLHNGPSSPHVTGKKKLTRKRQRNEAEWKQNLRKKARESGKEYIDVKGKNRRARKVQDKCSCRLKCYQKINASEQQKIHDDFWMLTDDEKRFFYSSHVKKVPKKRVRTTNKDSKKKFTFYYYFQVCNVEINVCKIFFLKTLDISQRRINYHFDQIQNNSSDIPRPYRRGKNRKKFLKEDELDLVREHINSFPRMESHYCRAETKREYLEGTLNITTMFSLFKEAHPEAQTIKKFTYRKIFNNEFNISFHRPKKDRCDTCEEFKNSRNTDELKSEQEKHLERKEESKRERNKDRNETSIKIAVVCFDFENVFSLPRAEVSNFFYKRKFNSYNLTAHVNLNNKAYSAVWHQGLAGRNANCIASALRIILKRVILDLPDIEEIILWSDSCVPQNRNQVMTTALKYFMRENPQIKKITQKFSEPGHGNIQEVDAIHSKIERFLKTSEVYSHLGLVKQLIKLEKKSVNKMATIMMITTEFFDYQAVSKHFSYSQIPYTKVKLIEIEAVKTYHVTYSENFTMETSVEINIAAQITRRTNKRRSTTLTFPDTVPIQSNSVDIAPEKKKDIKSMYKYMPAIDVEFYKAILK